ncbi:MAG: hypothetical protein ACUVWR_19065 [Anaerolineae bacterium]
MRFWHQLSLVAKAGIVACVCALVLGSCCGALAILGAAMSTPTPGTARLAVTDAQPAVTAGDASASLPPMGSSRLSPVPLGQVHGYGGDKMVCVLNLLSPGDPEIASITSYHPEPGKGMKWVIVKLSLVCSRGPEETCSFSSYSFRLVGRKGKIHSRSYGYLLPASYQVDQELFGGSDPAVAYLEFEVPEDDGDFVLIWDPGVGYQAIYYQLREAG